MDSKIQLKNMSNGSFASMFDGSLFIFKTNGGDTFMSVTSENKIAKADTLKLSSFAGLLVIPITKQEYITHFENLQVSITDDTLVILAALIVKEQLKITN